jgi:hypothetical protein
MVRLFAALMLATAACSRDAPPVERAPAEVAVPPPAPAPLSRFSVPLEYDITSVLRVVEQVVPRTFGSMDSVRQIGTDAGKHYAFEATRGPFTAFASGREVHLRATLAYSARGYYKPRFGPTISAGCGGKGERPRIVVELATPLALTPDWRLASNARLVTIQPATTEGRDRCDVGILNTDVTDRVIGAARAAITGQLRRIDGKVGGVDLTDRVTNWWTLLGKPIRLADGVWLMLQPEQLRMGRVEGQSKVLSVPVTLDARPRIVTGALAPESNVRPLPALARDTMSEGFRIQLDGNVDYETATRAVSQALANRTLTRAGRSVTVRDVRVSPASRGRLALALSFVGDANGRLLFVGTPRYDETGGEVSVPDLDYDLDTDSKLVSGYAWLKSDELRNTLREKAHVPVAPALAKGRELLLGGLNRKLGDAVTLSATVDSVRVTGLHVTREGLLVRAEATGRAQMQVRQR